MPSINNDNQWSGIFHLIKNHNCIHILQNLERQSQRSFLEMRKRDFSLPYLDENWVFLLGFSAIEFILRKHFLLEL